MAPSLWSLEPQYREENRFPHRQAQKQQQGNFATVPSIDPITGLTAGVNEDMASLGYYDPPATPAGAPGTRHAFEPLAMQHSLPVYGDQRAARPPQQLITPPPGFQQRHEKTAASVPSQQKTQAVHQSGLRRYLPSSCNHNHNHSPLPAVPACQPNTTSSSGPYGSTPVYHGVSPAFLLRSWRSAPDDQTSNAGSPAQPAVSRSSSRGVPFSHSHPPTDPSYLRANGFSENYRGNPLAPRNRSADVPDSKNTSIFATHLPLDITVQQLLSRLRGVGRIYACVVSPPKQDSFPDDADPQSTTTLPFVGFPVVPAQRPQQNRTAAAKIVFFNHPDAERFLHTHDGCHVRGLQMRLRWNRIKTDHAELAMLGRDVTRVVRLSSENHALDLTALERWFEERFYFDLVDKKWVTEGGRKLAEFEFGSYRCQAETAVKAVQRELEPHGVRIWHGLDPCA